MADEPRLNENSSLAAVAITLVGASVLLAASFGTQFFLAYEVPLWEGAAARLPRAARYFACGGGIVTPVLVGLAAPPAGRLARNIDGRFLRWLASFGVGMSAITVAVGAGLFATKCVTMSLDLVGLLNAGLYFLALAAMLFGGWGGIRAMWG
ncbi:MAG: hypothetical protein PVH29_04375 [Candidatus Zixiibacteriota bacterium]|jgi:hypothetical protein